MNYLEIILNGYESKKNSLKHLDQYFFRECEKAEKQHYAAAEFFDGCFDVVNGLIEYSEMEYQKRKGELYSNINLIETNRTEHVLKEGETIEQRKRESIAFYKDQLKNLKPAGIPLSKIKKTPTPEAILHWQLIEIEKAIKAAIILKKAKLFEQLEQSGHIYLNEFKEMFFKKYGTPNNKIINDELSEINNFIEKAESLSTNETFRRYCDINRHNIKSRELEQLVEYSRLKNDYYYKPERKYYAYFNAFFNDQTVYVYSRYFLYKDWLEGLNKQFAPESDKKETELPETLEQLFEYQNFLIPKVPIKDVYEHFKILTEKTNKFDEFYLTNEQLSIFIKSTFIDLKPQKQKLNCKTFIKKDIRKVFYEFYLSNKNHELNLIQVKQKYFDILNNAFDGFSKNDYIDFHKT
jgi:hypothetical protein